VEHYALPAQVYGAGLVFARLGSFVVLLPGFGEATVPARIRLAFAFVLTLALYPVVRAGLPGMPDSLGGLAGQLFLEIAIGLGLSALLRLFMGTLSLAGEIISLQTTISFAQTTNPTGSQPTVVINSFLSLIGLTLVFSTDLHQLFIGGIVRSYSVFPTGKPFPVRELSTLAVHTVGQIFALGVQLSAPVIVFSLVFNIGAGLIARAMPQFQVFFVAAPLTLLLGLSVFGLSLGLLGLVWIDRFRVFAAHLAMG
jgi:flagellar biosynthetic protein FliR